MGVASATTPPRRSTRRGRRRRAGTVLFGAKRPAQRLSPGFLQQPLMARQKAARLGSRGRRFLFPIFMRCRLVLISRTEQRSRWQVACRPPPAISSKQQQLFSQGTCKMTIDNPGYIYKCRACHWGTTKQRSNDPASLLGSVTSALCVVLREARRWGQGLSIYAAWGGSSTPKMPSVRIGAFVIVEGNRILIATASRRRKRSIGCSQEKAADAGRSRGRF